MLNIKSKLANLKQQLGQTTLVAVTKYATDKQIAELLASGHKIIGESRIQVAKQKKEKFNDPEIKWHLIGHLQTNKAKDAVKIFDLIQTVDSERLALEINKAAANANKVQNVLIQINIGREEQKTGIEPETTARLVDYVRTLPNLKLCGLMAMAPYSENPELARPYFKEMKTIFDQHFTTQDILSIGMSGDYRVAVEEGGNMVRIGSSLFS